MHSYINHGCAECKNEAKSRHGKCIGGMAKNVDLDQNASETSFGYSQLLKIERE